MWNRKQQFSQMSNLQPDLMTNYIHNQLPMSNPGVYQHSYQPMYDHHNHQPIPHFNPAPNNEPPCQFSYPNLVIRDNRRSNHGSKNVVNKDKVINHILQNELQTLKTELLLKKINEESED